MAKKDDGLQDPRLGQRILAEARLRRYETKVELAIKAALRRQKAKAIEALRSQHLTAAAPPDPFDEASWDSMITDEVLPVVGNVLGDISQKVFNFLALPPEARAQILGKIDLGARTESFVSKVTSIGPDISARLMDELSIGVGKGESYGELTDRIDTVFNIGDNIAERIARTETHGASMETQHLSAQAINQAGFQVTKQWLCVAGSTRVASFKPLQVVERRRSHGLMVTLTTAAGRVLTVTPNHPVFTDQGWVAAETLNVGSNLVCYDGLDAGNIRPAMRLSSVDTEIGHDPDIEDMPLRIDECFDAATQNRSSARMVSRVVDFNSEPVNCDVEAIAINGDLLANLKAPVSQPLGQILFELSDVELELLLSECSPPELLVSQFEHSIGVPSGHSFSGNSSSTFDRGVPSTQESSVGMTTDWDSGLDEITLDNVRRNAQLLGDGPTRAASNVWIDDEPRIDFDSFGFGPQQLSSSSLGNRLGIVSKSPARCVGDIKQLSALPEATANGHRAATENCSDFDRGLSASISLDNVINIEFNVLAGHVYDLTTANGWFVAEGIIVHNSTADDRTRADHVDADGQEVDISDPFQVGDDELMYPGDPDGSAEQICNCRCSCTYSAPDDSNVDSPDMTDDSSDNTDDRLGGGNIILRLEQLEVLK